MIPDLMRPLLATFILGLAACASSAGNGPQEEGCDTRLSGVVTAPNGLDPVPGATVFIPRDPGVPPPPLPTEIGCQPCASAQDLMARAQAISGPDGSFTLHGLPAEGPLPVYIQKGMWRRRLSVTPTACRETFLASAEGHLPRSRAEGDLPSIAVAVGDFDAIECVLRHMGVDPREFTPPTSTGAVHLYENEHLYKDRGGAPGAVPISQALLDFRALRRYQLLLLNCTDTGAIEPHLRDPIITKNLLRYVQEGGRLYATDWSYNYVAQQPELSPYLCFDDGGACGERAARRLQGAATGFPIPFTSSVPPPQAQPGDFFVKGLREWLRLPRFGLAGGEVPIQDLLLNWAMMRDPPAGATSYPAITWLRGQTNGADRPLTVTFDYPLSPSCGRVLYSSHHTRGHVPPGVAYPAYCPVDIIPQERVLEYLLFEVSTCTPVPG